MSNERITQYVILPPRGTRAATSRSTSADASRDFLRSLATTGASESVGISLRVVDSIREDGAKLVELKESDVQRLHASHPGVVVAPVMYYRPARAERPKPRLLASPLSHTVAAAGPITVQVDDSWSGAGVEGALVVAFTDFANRYGADAATDQNGQANLPFSASSVALERLYVFPPLAGYWGFVDFNLNLRSGATIPIQPIDMNAVDCVRHFHGSGQPQDGSGVVVGVIDTGVGPHPDLAVTGTEGAGGDVDNGEGHGSHVAGIIAASGSLPGIAPGVRLKSYRVFGVQGGLAANYDIAKAIDQAVLDGCHLINLSLKIDDPNNPTGTAVDPVVQYALEDARQAGVLPIVAAGNDTRSPVDFPAKDPMSIAVSAMGRIGTFPAGSNEEADVLFPPDGTDPNDFVAAFSNVGPEIDLVGPGVGVVSTVPGGYGVMSGTSMACPAVTGMVARILARNPQVLQLPGDAHRSAQFASLALAAASSLGFGSDFEGQGIL